MTLPVGVTFAECTISRPVGPDGTVGSLTSVRLTVDRRLVWLATGETVYNGARMVLTPDAVTGVVTVQLPHVNQAGFVDQSGQAVTLWSYTVSWEPKVGVEFADPISKTFQVLVGQNAVSLDSIPDGDVTSSVSAPSSSVSSIAGLTGAVSADDLRDALGETDSGWYGIADWLGFDGLPGAIRVRRVGSLVSLAFNFNGETTNENFLNTLAGLSMFVGVRPADGVAVRIDLVYDDSTNAGPIIYNANNSDFFATPDLSLTGGNDCYLYGQVTYLTDDDPADLSAYGPLVDGTGGHHGGV